MGRDDQRLRRIEATGDADHDLVETRALQPLAQAVRLDVVGLEAELVQARIVVRHEGEALDLAGKPEQGGESELGEIDWFTPAAQPMAEGDWETWFARSVMVYLNGNAIPEPDVYGRKIEGDSLLLLLNADGDEITFTLPPREYASAWQSVLSTSTTSPKVPLGARGSVPVEGRSILILRAIEPAQEDEPEDHE